MKADLFWAEYEKALAADVAARPTEYPPHDSAEDYARGTIAKLRRTVELGDSYGQGFGRINYRSSRACKKAAKLAGVPFTRAGLDSLYDFGG